MATVPVTVPGLLARFTGDRRTVEVEAATVRGAVDALVAAYPALAPHLFAADGELRPYLRLYRDGVGVARGDGYAVRLDDGDEVLVLQAVSGG